MRVIIFKEIEKGREREREDIKGDRFTCISTFIFLS